MSSKNKQEETNKESSLINDIIEKKELRNLDVDIARKILEDYTKENPKLILKVQEKNYNKKSKEYKQLVKEVRKKLREIYGVFQIPGKREKLLEQDKIEEILNYHKSTKERTGYYTEVYENILEITGKGSIIDLACGLNPIAYNYLGYKPEYFASDISTKDLEFINKFFLKKGIPGKTRRIDLVEEKEEITKIKSDICFLFKTLDSLEARKKNISKWIINNLNCEWIVVSFTKISLGGNKPIEKKRRNWFFNFLKTEKYQFFEFEIPNEFFIIIKK